jgi:hypothetical protein
MRKIKARVGRRMTEAGETEGEMVRRWEDGGKAKSDEKKMRN